MKVTTDASLPLSLSSEIAGTSRQFVGFNTEVDESVIERIWTRAAEFFPKLRDFSLTDLSRSRKVRIGLRPYSKSISSLICDFFLRFLDFNHPKFMIVKLSSIKLMKCDMKISWFQCLMENPLLGLSPVYQMYSLQLVMKEKDFLW